MREEHYAPLIFRFQKKGEGQTWCRKAVHRHPEVVLQEEEADDGEEINEKEGQNGGQNDGASVSCHALDHIEQGLLSDHQVKQLSTTTTITTTTSERFGNQVCFGDTTECKRFLPESCRRTREQRGPGCR